MRIRSTPRFIALGAATATSLAVPMTASGSATGGTTPTEPPPGTSWDQQTAIQNGAVTEQTIQHSDGSTEYVYGSSLAGGTLHMYQPPPTFSPLIASAAQLAAYGFPPRPTGGNALQQWLSAMSAYTGVPTPNLVFSAGTADPLQATSAETQASGQFTVSSPNWAGYVNTPGSNGDYVALSADTIVPEATSPDCSSSAVDDAWIGLGGVGSHPMIQDGVAWNDPNSDAWTAWYEVFEANGAGNIGPNRISDSSIRLYDGDGLYMYDDYVQSAEQADFFIEDTTTGQVTQFTKTNVPSSYWDGSSADFIMEQIAAAQLKHFSPQPWSGAEAETSNGAWNLVANNPNTKWVEVNGSNQNVDVPGTLSGGSWTQYWQQCN